MALHISRDGHAGRFDLLGIKPAALQGHQAVLAKRNGVAARSQAGAAATMGLLGGAEIGAIVGADSNTVKARLFRARDKLRGRLGKYFRIGREAVTFKRA